MKPRARRITLAAAVLGAGVVAVLLVAHWSAVRDHVKASYFRLTGDPESESPSARAVTRPTTRILQLRVAKAEEIVLAIAGALEEIPQPRRPLVVPHVGANTLIIQAPPEEFEGIVKRIEELDGAAPEKEED